MSRGDSADAQNGAPDASAAAEKLGGTREEIPTDQPFVNIENLSDVNFMYDVEVQMI